MKKSRYWHWRCRGPIRYKNLNRAYDWCFRRFGEKYKEVLFLNEFEGNLWMV